MEDILASIRRIIADDHLHAAKPGYGSPRRTAQQVGNGADAGTSARTPGRQRGNYDDVLELARAAPMDRPEAQFGTEVDQRAIPGEVDPAYAEDGDDLDPASAENDPARDSNGFRHLEDAPRARVSEIPSYGREEAEPPAVEPEPEYHEMSLSDPGTGEQLLSPPLGASVMSAFETLAATVVLQNTPMLEQTMRDLLRPMLKSWLDENLPTLVERLVRTEIERVARGNRG